MILLALLIALISFCGGAATAVLLLCAISVDRARVDGYPKAPSQPTGPRDWEWPEPVSLNGSYEAGVR